MAGWLPEVLVLLVGLVVLFTARASLYFMFVQEIQQELLRFGARGRIVSFTSRPISPDLVLAHLTVSESEDGHGEAATSTSRGLRDVVISLGPDVLKSGSSFEKQPGTATCEVDGIRYELFRPFGLREVFLKSFGLDE